MPVKGLSPSPRVSASIFSKMFFLWLYPLFNLGSTQNLELSDLYDPLPEDETQYLGERLIAEWKTELDKAAASQEMEQEESNKVDNNEGVVFRDENKLKPNYRPSLLRALIRIFGKDWAKVGILLFLEECLAKIAQPIFLGYLLKYFNGEFESSYHGYLFASMVIISIMYYTISHHPSFFCIIHLNMKVRIACSALMYSKTMKLSQAALSKTTVGQTVNLLSNDVARFDLSLNFLHYLWIGPTQLLISVWILWGYFGPTCFSGVIFLLLFTPFQSLMGHLFSKLRLQVAGKTDKRVRIMNEILNGIRVIKMYAWEIPFSKMVADSREDEIKSIGRQMTLRAVNLGLYYVSSKIIIFLTLVTYVLTGNSLTAEKVFVAMALYQNIRLLMTIFFPWGISFLAETKVSIKRIEDFLLLQDYVPGRGRKSLTPTKSVGPVTRRNSYKRNTDVCLQIKNMSAKWNDDSTDLTLNKIELTANKGKLIAVIGPVGSGKSSLLQAILAELPTTCGEIILNGKIGYSSQDAWVFGGTLRDNILFGHKYDPKWYARVVEACALRADFATMSYGDKSLVGDKGLSLSGGQKARINLARAVYADADVYLLDDPLSAVDTEIGRQLFESCIGGLLILRNKICVLVTHQLQHLPNAHEILLMNNGIIMARGDFSTLSKRNVNFAQILEAPEFIDNVVGSEELFQGLPSLSGSMTSLAGATNRKASSVKSVDAQSVMKSTGELTFSGSIGLKTYWKYLRIGSNLCLLFFILFSNLVAQALYSGSDFWLQHWIKGENMQTVVEMNSPDFPSNFTAFNPSTEPTLTILDQDEEVKLDDNFNITGNSSLVMDWMSTRTEQISIYAILIAALFVMTLVRTIGFFFICQKSSIALHLQLFYGVLRAPMLFFESNPVGRILNRFTKDIYTIDENLPYTLFDTLEVGLQVLGVIVVVSIISPVFLIPSGIIAVLFVFIRNYFQKTARSLKRLEGTARSPVFSHLSTTLNGLATIRAFQAQDQFHAQFNEHLDRHTAVFYLFNASARWLGIVVDWISILYITAVTFGVVALQLDGPSAGLAVSSAMSLISWFQWGVRQSAEAENQMVSVERVIEYADIKSEAPLDSFPERKPPKNWPTKAEIEFQNLCVKYGSETEPFLKSISCVIRPLEKVGIIGRTGAGKTSLISALFRLTEPSSGTIIIDGVDVLQIGLHDLRQQIAIIPQDPILFVGTLRKNLDPLEEYADSEIWEVLRDVEMAKDLSSGLDSNVSEGGSNFSVGQRQLICMGRAILRRNRILVMDEATANIDTETDVLIQNTIREKFINCTVLTVAHRLHTVIDSDRIMVLEAGAIKEFDEPYTLLQNEAGAFFHLVQETGQDTAQELIGIAKQRAELIAAMKSGVS